MLLWFLSAGWLGWFVTNTNIVCDHKSSNTYMILNFVQDNTCKLIFSANIIIKNSHTDLLSGIAKENFSM